MRKLNHFTVSGDYASPVCDVIPIGMMSVVCDSPVYGDPNAPGSIISEDDDDIYNY